MTYRPADATGGWAQLWNGEHRLAETHRGTDRLTFKYDYLGRRVERSVYSGGALVSKTHYVYDGFRCVEELDGLDGNAVVRRHAWQPTDVGPDVILATTNADGTSYFLHDANRSVMQATGGNGGAAGAVRLRTLRRAPGRLPRAPRLLLGALRRGHPAGVLQLPPPRARAGQMAGKGCD